VGVFVVSTAQPAVAIRRGRFIAAGWTNPPVSWPAEVSGVHWARWIQQPPGSTVAASCRDVFDSLPSFPHSLCARRPSALLAGAGQ